jgi:hypothetical protein
MSFLIDTMYNVLGLTADEQATVNAALPSIKDLLDTLDAHLDDIKAVEQLLVVNKMPINQLLTDWGVIGPNISASISDGQVDLFDTMSAFNDAKSVIASNPKNVQAAEALYNKLVPAINQAVSDWPKISPAVQVIMVAAQRRNVASIMQKMFKN